MPLQAKQIVINNLLVNYYQQAGGKAQPVLVFLHGWRSEGMIWQKVIEKLPECNVYVLDLPGFGRSQTPQNFTLQNYADVVDAFIKKFDLKNIVLVGHSFGGRIAIKLAARTPAYLQKIVLVNSAGMRGIAPARTFKTVLAKIAQPFFVLPFLQSARKKIYTALGSEDYVATPQLQRTFVNIINEDLTPLLAKIIQPTLLVWGENDADIPLTQARIMERNVPGSKLVILSQAGHFSFLDQPEIFSQELKNFLIAKN